MIKEEIERKIRVITFENFTGLVQLLVEFHWSLVFDSEKKNSCDDLVKMKKEHQRSVLIPMYIKTK